MATVTHIDAAAEIKADQASITRFIAERDKLIALRDDLASEEAALNGNGERYSEAARVHAAGGDADPAAILADSDRRRHRIAGLKTLITEQEQIVEALQESNRAATNRELARRHAEHLVNLDKAIVEAEAKTNDAQQQLDVHTAELRKLRLDREEVLRSRQRDFNSLMRRANQ